MSCGREKIFIISNLPIGEYIDFSIRKKYRIAQQYIDNKTTPEKDKINSFSGVVLSYSTFFIENCL
jgi:hypothetical protein